MKTTVDLPDASMQRVKIAATHRRTTLKKLVIEGLEHVLGSGEATASARAEALARLASFAGVNPAPRQADSVWTFCKNAPSSSQRLYFLAIMSDGENLLQSDLV